MSKKVVHIVLNPFIQDSRVMRECKSLAAAGYKVTVIAVHENNLQEWDEQDGFQVHRIKLISKTLWKHPIMQIVKYAEFVIRAMVQINRIRPGISHGHDPNGLLIAYLAKLICKSKLIYDSHEYWRDAVHQRGKYKSIFKLGVKLETFCIKRADTVTTVNGSIAQLIREENTVKKVSVIRNIPEKSATNILSAGKVLFPPCEFNLIYTGNVEVGRGIRHIISAMAGVKQQIGLVIVGRDSEYRNKMKDYVHSLNLQERVRFLPAVQPQEIVSVCKLAQAGIAPIRNICTSYYLSLPNKVFEYIHAGIPLLVNNLPEMSALINQHDIGMEFCIEDISDIVEKIHTLYDDKEKYNHFCKNAVKASQTLNWEEEQKQLLQLYQGGAGN